MSTETFNLLFMWPTIIGIGIAALAGLFFIGAHGHNFKDDDDDSTFPS
jgi:hypothetical protein